MMMKEKMIEAPLIRGVGGLHYYQFSNQISINGLKLFRVVTLSFSPLFRRILNGLKSVCRHALKALGSSAPSGQSFQSLCCCIC